MTIIRHYQRRTTAVNIPNCIDSPVPHMHSGELRQDLLPRRARRGTPGTALINRVTRMGQMARFVNSWVQEIPRSALD